MRAANAVSPVKENFWLSSAKLLLSIFTFLGLPGCDVNEQNAAGSNEAQAGLIVQASAKVTAGPLDPSRVATPPAKLAFPGATGFGAGSLGGRGGTIIPVTTLADSGPGSFRACVVADGPRVCVFRVSGVIRFVSEPPVIKKPFLTIAGETAPGDGIILAHSGGPKGLTPLLIKNTHDVIVRHIRSRPDLLGDIPGANDAITIENSRDVIVDHVSGSWARDENINGHRQNDNVTISWSIFAEGLTPHDKCALLGSDPKGPQKLSFIGNLCAHTGDRNPDLNFTPLSCVEIINSVFYNAASQFAEIWESYGGTSANIAGNTFRAGPNTSPSAIGIDRQQIESTGAARVWLSDNQFDGKFVEQAPSLAEIISPQPICQLSMMPQNSSAAYEMVLRNAGTFPRDSFDVRIISEVQTRSGKIRHRAGTMPVLTAGVAYADTDSDGMSDAWENANGTKVNIADSWEDTNGDGLLNLEAFLDYAHNQKMKNQPMP
jgi:pectate lyase